MQTTTAKIEEPILLLKDGDCRGGGDTLQYISRKKKDIGEEQK